MLSVWAQWNFTPCSFDDPLLTYWPFPFSQHHPCSQTSELSLSDVPLTIHWNHYVVPSQVIPVPFQSNWLKQHPNGDVSKARGWSQSSGDCLSSVHSREPDSLTGERFVSLNIRLCFMHEELKQRHWLISISIKSTVDVSTNRIMLILAAIWQYSPNLMDSFFQIHVNIYGNDTVFKKDSVS